MRSVVGRHATMAQHFYGARLGEATVSVARGSHVWLRNVARCESTSARVTIWLNGSAVVAVLPPNCAQLRLDLRLPPGEHVLRASGPDVHICGLRLGPGAAAPVRSGDSAPAPARALEYRGPPAAAAPDAAGAEIDDGVEEIYTPSIQREMGIHTGLEEDDDEDDWESLSSGLEEYDDDDDESGEDGAEFLPFDGMGGGIYFD